MKNMRISKKLIISFIIVIIMAVVVGAVGIFGMYRINAADDALYNGNYMPTVKADAISQEVVAQRVFIRNFILFDSVSEAEDFKSAASSLAASEEKINKLLAEYEPTISNPEDRSAYNDFVRLYNGEWKAIKENIYNLGLNNQAAEAKKALIAAGDVPKVLDTLTTKLQEVNLADGKTAVDGNSTLFTSMTIIQVVVLVLAVAVAMLLALYISGLISKPLRILTGFMNKAGSSGDISLRPEDMENIAKYGQYKDETGQCISSTASFVKHITTISSELQTVANGDLNVEIEVLSEQDVMGQAMKKMVDSLNSMFSEINSATAQVSIGSKQIADGAQSLAQGSTEQASAVQELSASISEIAEKTKVNADMAVKAANLAGNIKSNAEKGNTQMDQMMQAVKEINDASSSISKVIKVIDDIAFQTNILALNAAVEAARAGQHGKGFAVVAEEVRSLAGKSAEAAKETGALIANSMEKAEMGSRIAGETAESLVEIVSGINQSTQIVGDIAKSSNEQATAITEINSGIDQVAQVVQQNSATAEESAAASEEMSGQANALEALIAQFKLKDSNQALGAGRRQHSLPQRASSTYDDGPGLGMGKY